MARKSNKTSHVLNLITNGAPAEPEPKETETQGAGASGTGTSGAGTEVSGGDRAAGQAGAAQASGMGGSSQNAGKGQEPAAPSGQTGDRKVIVVDASENDKIADAIRERLEEEVEREAGNADTPAQKKAPTVPIENGVLDADALMDAVDSMMPEAMDMMTKAEEKAEAAEAGKVAEAARMAEAAATEATGEAAGNTGAATGAATSTTAGADTAAGAMVTGNAAGTASSVSAGAGEAAGTAGSIAAGAGEAAGTASSVSAGAGEAAGTASSMSAGAGEAAGTASSVSAGAGEAAGTAGSMAAGAGDTVGAAAPAGEKKVRGPRYRMVNVMEEVVNRYDLSVQMAKYGVCNCSRCHADVQALTLTHLPSKYVVVDGNPIAPIIGYYESKYRSRLLTEVMKACILVKDKPRHNRNNVTPEMLE